MFHQVLWLLPMVQKHAGRQICYTKLPVGVKVSVWYLAIDSCPIPSEFSLLLAVFLPQALDLHNPDQHKVSTRNEYFPFSVSVPFRACLIIEGGFFGVESLNLCFLRIAQVLDLLSPTGQGCT